MKRPAGRAPRRTARKQRLLLRSGSPAPSSRATRLLHPGARAGRRTDPLSRPPRSTATQTGPPSAWPALPQLRQLSPSAPGRNVGHPRWGHRKRLRGLSTRELVGVAARFRLGSDPADVQTATRFALRSVARRHQQLSEEIAELDEQLDRLVAEVAPGLVSLPAVGTSHAATLLIVAGDNTERLSSEASFASLLCGVSPIEASSGKVVR